MNLLTLLGLWILAMVTLPILAYSCVWYGATAYFRCLRSITREQINEFQQLKKEMHYGKAKQKK